MTGDDKKSSVQYTTHFGSGSDLKIVNEGTVDRVVPGVVYVSTTSPKETWAVPLDKVLVRGPDGSPHPYQGEALRSVGVTTGARVTIVEAAAPSPNTAGGSQARSTLQLLVSGQPSTVFASTVSAVSNTASNTYLYVSEIFRKR